MCVILYRRSFYYFVNFSPQDNQAGIRWLSEMIFRSRLKKTLLNICRNLGVIFDFSLNLALHTESVVQSCFCCVFILSDRTGMMSNIRLLCLISPSVCSLRTTSCFTCTGDFCYCCFNSTNTGRLLLWRSHKKHDVLVTEVFTKHNSHLLSWWCCYSNQCNIRVWPPEGVMLLSWSHDCRKHASN